MAHHKSALKRIRQTKKRNYYNRLHKKAMKVAVRAVRESKTYEDAVTNLNKAVSVIDRNSAHGVIHKNFAANRKSQLARLVNHLKVQATATPTV